MENLIQLKRECENCKHYREHYVLISRSHRPMTEICALDKGHCMRRRPNHKLMSAWDTCEDWEAKKEEERK